MLFRSKKPGKGLSDRLVQGTQKFGGGSLMVWGCMLWEGPGFAARIDWKMDADLYTQILEDDFQLSLQFYHKNPQDIIFQQDNDPKLTFYCEIQPAIAVSKNPEHHSRMKHIDVMYHWLREKVEKGLLKLQFVPTDNMVANVLTKSLVRMKHEKCRTRLGICKS